MEKQNIEYLGKEGVNRLIELINDKADNTDVERINDELQDKVSVVKGKGLSTEDFTTELKDKLEGLSNYDSSNLDAKVQQIETTINTILDNPTDAIDSINEIKTFLSGITETNLQTLLDGITDNVNNNITPTINNLTELIAKLHATITFTLGPATVEREFGTTVSWNSSVVFDGDNLAYTVMLNDKTVGVRGSEPILLTNDTPNKIYNAVIKINDKGTTFDKTFNITISSYYPKYYGRSTSASITTEDLIFALTKQAISSSAAANNVSLSSNVDSYFWLCVPSGMTISKVTDADTGFGITFLDPTTVSTSKGDYKVYRSAQMNYAGTTKINVS